MYFPHGRPLRQAAVDGCGRLPEVISLPVQDGDSFYGHFCTYGKLNVPYQCKMNFDSCCHELEATPAILRDSKHACVENNRSYSDNCCWCCILWVLVLYVVDIVGVGIVYCWCCVLWVLVLYTVGVVYCGCWYCILLVLCIVGVVGSSAIVLIKIVLNFISMWSWI